MIVVVKMIAFIISLGIDTLMMSISIGFMRGKAKVKIALTFACAEALMPLLGLLIGQSTSRLIGDWTSVVGGIALLGVAVWFLFFEDEDDEEEKLERNLAGWTLLLTALSISLDELAVGFSIGLVGVPVFLTILLIALQAFSLTLLGIAAGSKLEPYLGGWAEKLTGIILGLLGLWILIDAIIHLVHQ